MNAKLHILGSSSSANGYLLQCGKDRLILEAGCKTKEYLQALNYEIADVQMLVTHKHGDHSRNINGLLFYGIPVYSCSDVVSQYPTVNLLKPLKKYKIGNFEVMALPVPHSVENYAYYIYNPDMGKMVFATDCRTVPYNLKNLNFLVIEANYSLELIIDQFCCGTDIRGSSNDHMEIGETISVINRLKSSELSKVILVHLSDANSDEEAFKQRIWSECGVRAETANKGDVFILSKEEF